MATCKQWRDIVFHSPKSWTRVEVDVYILRLDPRRLEKLLNRSGTMSIDIKLIFNENFGLLRDHIVADLLDSIAAIFRKELHRIRILVTRHSLYEGIDLIPQLFPSEQRTGLPRLECFYYIGPISDPYEEPRIGSLRAARVKSFICSRKRGQNFVWSSLEPESLGSLTAPSVDLYSFSSPSQIELLGKCRALRTLTLSSMRREYSSFDPSLPTFKVLHLESTMSSI
ncbi:hypothetical protein M422DRAFT_238689 [Sphaerobolus stellatus SS14]|nr:hypothetical protein M422DRAFT_238689 [Sphaerobolus stellatus SS14]